MLCDMERDDPEPEDIFDRIGFSVAKRDELIADYTFEEKKLLQLACILVIRPYVVLFDEPLDYCSEEYINKFIEVINTIKEGRIILISTGLLEISKRISEEDVYKRQVWVILLRLPMNLLWIRLPRCIIRRL